MRLDIGCGASPAHGYIGVDKYAPNAALKADALVLPFPPASVEEIRSAHALEHFAYADVPKALAEWMRVLEPGGRLTVIVPNMDYVAAYWLHGGDRQYAQQIAFGSQAHEGEFHRAGFRVVDVRDLLEAAGYEVGTCEARYTRDYNQESVVAQAIKPVAA